VVRALTGNWREEHLFVLKQALSIYDAIGRHLAECDAQLQGLLGGAAKAMWTWGAPRRPAAS
jgi:hypothetical protein